jgi:hypothetical protein
MHDRVMLAPNYPQEPPQKFQVREWSQLARDFDAMHLYAFALERLDERPSGARRVNLEAVRRERAKLRQKERDSQINGRDVNDFERRVHDNGRAKLS